MLKNNKASNNIIEAKPNAQIILFPVSENPLTEQKVEALEDTSKEIYQPVISPLIADEKTADLNVELTKLSVKNIERYAENFRLVTLIETGLTPRQALKNLGIKRPLRTVYDLVTEYRKFGKWGLLDKRWTVTKNKYVLTNEVQEIILAWFFQRPAAGYRALAELTAETCQQKNLSVPSESSVKKFLVNQPESVKYARRGTLGIKKWDRALGSKVEQKKTSFSNELWQGDDTPPRIWIRQKVKGSWKESKVYFSVLLDDFSRAIPGFIVSTKQSDSWTISLLHRQAMLPKVDPHWMVSGIPFQTESDQGSNWISKATQTMLSAVGINAVIDAPYYPNLKGKVERFFQHLDSNCLRKLPGHHDAIGKTEGAAQKHIHELLTLKQLREEITKWIVDVYHNKIHSETGRRPLELWQESVHFRPVENVEDLNILLLKHDVERSISNLGVRLVINNEKHTYWSPALENLKRRRVSIRYNPEDTESVFLYCASTNELLCEAWDLRGENPHYNYVDIKNTRKAMRHYMRGLKERSNQYFIDVMENDRVVEQQKEWDESRTLAEELNPEIAEESIETEELTNIIEMFRRNDRTR